MINRITVSSEEFRRKVTAFPTIFEVVLVNGTVLFCVGDAAAFNDKYRSDLPLIEQRVFSMTDGETQVINVAAKHVALVFPSIPSVQLFDGNVEEEASSITPLYKNPNFRLN